MIGMVNICTTVLMPYYHSMCAEDFNNETKLGLVLKYSNYVTNPWSESNRFV